MHNHPSGMLYPSQSDINITKKLKLAAQTLEIKVLDHLIVTEKTYFSFADEKNALMLLIYTPKITSRLKFVFKQICTRILGIPIDFTSVIEVFT